MPPASVIMTYRGAGDPLRQANLAAVLAWWARYPELELILVEQDDAPRLAGPLPHPTVRTLFAYNPAAFNKSWGLNLGARHAQSAWLLFTDADLIVGEALRAALTQTASGVQAVKPYRRLVDLTPAQSERVRGGDWDFVPDPVPGSAPDREGLGERLAFAGGMILLARGAFLALGGWDERFRGWGGEDDALSYRLERARLPAIELDLRPAVHLHHARPAASPQAQPHYAGNLDLLRRYREYSDAELARMAEVQRQWLGEPDKYRPRAP